MELSMRSRWLQLASRVGAEVCRLVQSVRAEVAQRPAVRRADTAETLSRTAVRKRLHTHRRLMCECEEAQPTAVRANGAGDGWLGAPKKGESRVSTRPPAASRRDCHLVSQASQTH